MNRNDFYSRFFNSVHIIRSSCGNQSVNYISISIKNRLRFNGLVSTRQTSYMNGVKKQTLIE